MATIGNQHTCLLLTCYPGHASLVPRPRGLGTRLRACRNDNLIKLEYPRTISAMWLITATLHVTYFLRLFLLFRFRGENEGTQRRGTHSLTLLQPCYPGFLSCCRTRERPDNTRHVCANVPRNQLVLVFCRDATLL